MNNLNKKILNTLKVQNLKPKSKLYFIIKNILAWFLTITSLLLSGFLTSALIFIFSNRVLIPLHVIGKFILIDFVLLFIGVYLSYRHFKIIKNSYRTSRSWLVLFGLLILFVLTFFFVQFHLYGVFDDFARKRFPQFSIQDRVHKEWSDPQRKGMLAGEIVNINDDGNIEIVDFRSGTHLVNPSLLDEVSKDLFLENLRVRMFGFEDGDIFYAEYIEPWEFRQKPSLFNPLYKKFFEKDNIKFLPFKGK